MYELGPKKERNDHGAVALLVGLLVSTGFVIALFVLVFDIASVYAERRVVQNASDISAIALVQECAVDGKGAISGSIPAYSIPVCTNQTFAQDFATRYANLNSPDHLTSVSELCGSLPLNPCADQQRGLFNCGIVDTSKYPRYLRIGADTNTPATTYLKPLFSSVLDPLIQVDVVGCTNAAWGKAKQAPIFFPFAVPICGFPSSLPANMTLVDYSATVSCTITDLEGVTFSYQGVPNGLFVLTDYVDKAGVQQSFGCPNSSQSVKLSVADTIYFQSSLRQVELKCGNGSQFSDTIKSYLGQSVFLPVITTITCSSSTQNCANFYSKVATFVSFKFLGAIFKGDTANAMGTAPSGGWPTDCTKTAKIQVCLNGTYVKSIVPGVDISTDKNFPAIGAQAVQVLP